MVNITEFADATIREIRIETHGISFLCVCGTHINGGWCAILNFDVSCELSEFADEGSMEENAATIADALLKSPYVRGLPKSGKALWSIAVDISKAITIAIANS